MSYKYIIQLIFGEGFKQDKIAYSHRRRDKENNRVFVTLYCLLLQKSLLFLLTINYGR